MSTGWLTDKVASDRYMPAVKSILGQHLIGEPAVEEDQQRNTDLIVLKMEAVRIGVRLRTPEFYDRNGYASEFTIRASRPSGQKTELAKIIEGWGDYFFYGHQNSNDFTLRAWALCDLNVFRLWFARHITANQGNVPGLLKPNADNSSKFRIFKFSDIPMLVVASDGIPDVEEIR